MDDQALVEGIMVFSDEDCPETPRRGETGWWKLLIKPKSFPIDPCLAHFMAQSGASFSNKPSLIIHRYKSTHAS